ncbi:MAG: type II secretion system protein [Gammaproteobacteria bacterium]|nr:type II secretion system protein [Gammaproteobacteria bacterium]
MNGHNEGFSMIELIIVMVITGIMAAIAFPKFGHVSNIDVYNAASHAKSDIRYAQELAMGNFRRTTIAFTSGSNSYTITGVAQPRELPPNSKAVFTSNLQCIFNSAGEPVDTAGNLITTAGGQTLTISSGGSNEQVTVSNITGTASIP